MGNTLKSTMKYINIETVHKLLFVLLFSYPQLRTMKVSASIILAASTINAFLYFADLCVINKYTFVMTVHCTLFHPTIVMDTGTHAHAHETRAFSLMPNTVTICMAVLTKNYIQAERKRRVIHPASMLLSHDL